MNTYSLRSIFFRYLQDITDLKTQLLEPHLRATVGSYSADEVAESLLKHLYLPWYESFHKEKKGRGGALLSTWLIYHTRLVYCACANFKSIAVRIGRNALISAKQWIYSIIVMAYLVYIQNIFTFGIKCARLYFVVSARDAISTWQNAWQLALHLLYSKIYVPIFR